MYFDTTMKHIRERFHTQYTDYVSILNHPPPLTMGKTSPYSGACPRILKKCRGGGGNLMTFFSFNTYEGGRAPEVSEKQKYVFCNKTIGIVP